MKAFALVSCCLIALVSARPEPPVGYQYNRPSSGGGNVLFNGGGGGLGGLGVLGAGSSNIGIGQSFGGGSSQSFNGGSFGGSGLGGFVGNVGGGGGSLGFGGNVIGSGSSGFGVSAPGPIIPQQAVVQKHIYVHVPPPEQEEVFHRQNLALPAPQKHYKIIFIKTPSPPSYAQQQLQLAAQNEEKTLVYVLVKKPEAPEDIVLQQPAPTQPSKPEVYFIKYKTQKGAGGAIGAGAINGGAIIGGGGAIGGGNLIGGASNLGGSIASLPVQTSIGPNIGSFGSGSSSGGVIAQAPAAQYGPPGQSGPY